MSPQTMKHPDYIGSGNVAAPVLKRLDITTFGTDADSLACLKLGYMNTTHAGSTPAVTPTAASVQVSGSAKTLTIDIKNSNNGSASSDVSFTITFGAAKADWSSGAATAYSLKDVIDLINEDDAGGTSGKLLRNVMAQIGPGGRYDMVMNGANAFLTDSAEIYIMPVGVNAGMTECLKRDMAVHTEDSDFMAYWRIGLPEEKDRRSLKLLDLWGAIGTDTGCTVQVVRDDDEDYVVPSGTWATDIANHEVVYEVAAASLPSASGASTGLNHKPDEAYAVRGPLLVIVKGDTDAAQTVQLNAIVQAVL